MLLTTVSMSDDTPFIAMNGDCTYPGITAESTNVYMVWLVAEPRPALYFMQSTDEGRSWKNARKMTGVNADCMPPSVAVNSGIVHLAWIDCGEIIDGELYYARSLDGGDTWEKYSILVGNINSAQFPLISCAGNDVYLIWQDVTTKVYCKVSHDKGRTWEQEVFLGEVGKHSCYCYPPALSINGNSISVVWNDIKDKKGPSFKLFGFSLFNSSAEKKISSIVCRKSFDAGRTWNDPRILTSAGVSKEMNDEIENPTMFANGATAFLFWLDKHNLPLGEMLFTRLDPAAKKGRITGKPLFVTPKRSPKCPSVVFDNAGNLHLAWTTSFGGDAIVQYGEIDSTGNIVKEMQNLTSTIARFQNPVITRTTSGMMHIVWFTKPLDKKVSGRIFLKTSSDNGKTWETRETQIGNTQIQTLPSPALD